jgi:hypothetical protein
MQVVEHHRINKRTQKNSLILVIMLCGFLKEISHTSGNLLGNGLDHT